MDGGYYYVIVVVLFFVFVIIPVVNKLIMNRLDRYERLNEAKRALIQARQEGLGGLDELFRQNREAPQVVAQLERELQALIEQEAQAKAQAELANFSYRLLRRKARENWNELLERPPRRFLSVDYDGRRKTLEFTLEGEPWNMDVYLDTQTGQITGDRRLRPWPIETQLAALELLARGDLKMLATMISRSYD